MARYKTALKDFLDRNCRILPAGETPSEDDVYVFNTEGDRPFMTDAHLREILRACGQEMAAPAVQRRGDNGHAIMVRGRKEPEVGIDQIRIPVKLARAFNDQQSAIILRNLEGIRRDLDEGRLYLTRLEALFQDTATVTISTTPEADRIYVIIGRLSETDKRLYMERYAEQVTSKTLFDIAKALNAHLSQYIPEDSREKFFIEGRDLSDRKIKYGEEVGTELLLSDEGAWMYTDIANKVPDAKEVIMKLFRQAMIDPFGLSLKHYMGKHNIMKIGKRPLAKVSGFGTMGKWIGRLFD